MSIKLVGSASHFRPSYAGAATISGTVKVLTVPASRPVILLARDNLLAVAEVRSALDGGYSFTGLAKGREWIVVAFDDAGAYNATIADRVQT